MKVKLSWFDNEGQQQARTIETPFLIGRDARISNIVIQDTSISRRHVRLDVINGRLQIEDLYSQNGTFVNGEKIQKSFIQQNTHVKIGRIKLFIQLLDIPANPVKDFHLSRAYSLIFDPQTDQLQVESIKSYSQPTFPPYFFKQAVVPLAEIEQSGFPLEEITYLAIGGGLGSFTWVDHLIIYGVNPKDIMSIGFEANPYGRYRRLCQNSQIPEHERLRSNSDSCPDCIWGWPGYAVREVWTDLWLGRWRKGLKTAWQIFGEPTFVQTYTPISKHVFDSIDREAARIDWNTIWQYGRVKAIRKCDDGRYVVAYSQSQGRDVIHRFVLAQYIHLAVGYPGVRFLPDLQKYRETTQDHERVVNAYEPHQHIYNYLRHQGGTVLIRGRGIVASRIIQTIHEERQHNHNIKIIHLHRQPLLQGKRYKNARRTVKHQWEFQPFNWPKAAWGGELRAILEQANDDERSQILSNWDGTTTADRVDWQQLIEQGLQEGWYTAQFGQVQCVKEGDNGQLVSTITQAADPTQTFQCHTNFIIDCTGLESDVSDHPLLNDLIQTYHIRLNGQKRLYVSNDFEISEMRHQNGRLYACGVITLGGPYAPVDSFLGLQYAALRSVDHLSKSPHTKMRPLGILRSCQQWVRWALGVKP